MMTSIKWPFQSCIKIDNIYVFKKSYEGEYYVLINKMKINRLTSKHRNS